MKMTSITRIALILVLVGGVPMLRAPAAWAQTATLSGIVTDKASGESLLGVNVIVAGTALGTTTDLHGNYRLDLSSETQTLVFSYIGFKTQRFEVTPGTATLNVALEEDVLGFETIVVSVSGQTFEWGQHFHAWYRLTRKVGETVEIILKRGGEEKRVRLRVRGD